MESVVDKPLTNGYHNGHADNITKNELQTHESKGAPPYNSQSQNGNSTLNGPNQVIPATEYTTTLAEGRVRLRMGESGPSAEPPLSIPGVMSRTVARYPDQAAFATRTADGVWKTTSYKEYQQQVRICAKAFLKLGLEKYHSVCILGFNSPEWFISDLAAIHAGGLATGVYTTNNAEACRHVLASSQCNIVVVQDSKQMEKILTIWPKLPHLKAAIQWEGIPDAKRDDVYTWEKLMELGNAEPEAKLNEALKKIAINECCTLVYTSGTVGAPKAVMLSHDNLYYETVNIVERLNLDVANERIVSYLPLSHVAAQVIDIHMPIVAACTIYFADKDALKGTLVKTLQEVEPTKFLGVPRVWEKMHEKMLSIGASNGYIKQAVAGWAKSASIEYYMERIKGNEPSSWTFSLARFLVLNRVKAALGFSKCTIFATAAAPLSADVKQYFLSLDIPIMEAFGMSEAAGAHCFSTPDNFNLDTVGTLLQGSENKFDNPDPATGQGEICMRGRHVFMGYLGEPGKTADALDKDGWLHSGDIGRSDENGLIYITGRIKEMIITAGGENVAPVPIEQQLKADMIFISHAVVVGDRRKFLAVLLTFKTETDPETGAALDKLSSDSLRWLSSIGSSATTVTQVLNSPDKQITKAIEEGITRSNVHAISNAQKIQKFAILPADLTTLTGELGPTLKIKRNVVAEKYAETIDNFYK